MTVARHRSGKDQQADVAAHHHEQQRDEHVRQSTLTLVRREGPLRQIGIHAWAEMLVRARVPQRGAAPHRRPSARAWSIDTPAASRPKTSMGRPSRGRFRENTKENAKRGMAERVGVLEAAFRNPNESGRLQRNAWNVNDLAFPFSAGVGDSLRAFADFSIAMTLEMALDAIHSEDLRCRRLAGLLKVHHFAPWQRLRRALPQTGVKRRRESLQKSGPFKKIEELMNVQGIGEQSFLKLKALVAITPAKTAER